MQINVQCLKAAQNILYTCTRSGWKELGGSSLQKPFLSLRGHSKKKKGKVERAPGAERSAAPAG